MYDVINELIAEFRALAEIAGFKTTGINYYEEISAFCKFQTEYVLDEIYNNFGWSAAVDAAYEYFDADEEAMKYVMNLLPCWTDNKADCSIFCMYFPSCPFNED